MAFGKHTRGRLAISNDQLREPGQPSSEQATPSLLKKLQCEGRGQVTKNDIVVFRDLTPLLPQVLLEERVDPLPRVTHHEAAIEVVEFSRIGHERRQTAFAGFQELIDQQR